MRSIGKSAQVVTLVLENPERLSELIAALEDDDPRVRMRAADAAEKITVRRPDLLQPYKQVLLTQIASIPQQEVRWHVCQMLPRLKLTRAERRRAFAQMQSWLTDKSGIVRAFAMQGLADLAQQDETLKPTALETIRAAVGNGTPAMRARGKRLLKELA